MRDFLPGFLRYVTLPLAFAAVVLLLGQNELAPTVVGLIVAALAALSHTSPSGG
jgi:hypothetical protein